MQVYPSFVILNEALNLLFKGFTFMHDLGLL